MDKNAIKKFATWARRELIERVRQQAYRYDVGNADADWNAISAHGVVLTPTERAQRQALIGRMKAKGYDAVIEEVAYTWFDRFCALRFMEVNGYLPGRTRMFSDENGAFRPQILSDALSISLPGLDIDRVIQLKEENGTEELFKYLLLTLCNTLKPILTLFQPDDRGCAMFERDYTWLLLPDSLLREGSVPEQMVLTIPEEDWQDAVQIVGWLYQYYNAEPKDQVFANLKKNIKISKKDIPAATQLFTPDWIVRYMVENSLGRLWVEGHPNDALKAGWKYYLEEAEQEPEVQAQLAKIREGYAAIRPEDILCIDPCMGSGHILVYMFDVLVQIYEDYGYPTRDAVASIVEHNLWGLDIDDRAAQLANFAVMMVARRYDKGWFRRGIQPHVMAIQESNGIDRNHLRFLGNTMSDLERNIARQQLEALLDEFTDAKEYGSILQPQDYDWEALRRFVRMTAPEQQLTLEEAGIEGTQERLMQIIDQGQALAQKYHVVVTNPPYMGSGSMPEKLNKYARTNYTDSKSDLFAVFMERIQEMLTVSGYQAMITQHAWMYLSSFAKLRLKMLTHTMINMTHLGARAFDEIGGEVVQTTAFVSQHEAIDQYRSTIVRLVDPVTQRGKEDLFLAGSHRFMIKSDSFKLIPGAPFAYSMSEKLVSGFKGHRLDEYCMQRMRICTGDNERFTRMWHEVSKGSMLYPNRWVAFSKGGEYRKWYGNFLYLLDYKDNGYELKHSAGFSGGSEEYYFKPGLVWTDLSTGKLSFRYFPEGGIACSAGPFLFADSLELRLYIAGFLNSSVADVYAKLLCVTLHFQWGDIAKFPFILDESKLPAVVSATSNCISESRSDWDSFETSWDFQRHPLLPRLPLGSISVTSEQLSQRFEAWQQEAESRFQQLKANEEELNRIFIGIYGLQDELTPEVEDKDVTVRRADLGRDIRSLISYAVGCMMGRYSLDRPGLQFAGGDWRQWLAQQEGMTWTPDKDGILPITDDEYFSDDIVTMFVNWVRTVYGAETLEENLKFISSALYPSGGGSARELIRQYFLNDFYKDHLRIYQKRPIYWLFDSGKKNGFKCLVYMHRWQRDTMARVRTDYVHEMQSRYRTAIEDLTRRVEGASGSERVRLQKQLAKIQAQDAELLAYEEKVHHLADQMIAIDLDDGVKHNYAIFEDVLAAIK